MLIEVKKNTAGPHGSNCAAPREAHRMGDDGRQTMHSARLAVQQLHNVHTFVWYIEHTKALVTVTVKSK